MQYTVTCYRSCKCPQACKNLRWHIEAHGDCSLEAAVAPQEAAASCARTPQQAACAPLRPVAIHLNETDIACVAAYSKFDSSIEFKAVTSVCWHAISATASQPALTPCATHACAHRHIDQTYWRCTGPTANGLVQLLREGIRVTSPAYEQLMQGRPRCIPRTAHQNAGAEQSWGTQRCWRLVRMAVAVPYPELS